MQNNGSYVCVVGGQRVPKRPWRLHVMCCTLYTRYAMEQLVPLCFSEHGHASRPMRSGHGRHGVTAERARVPRTQCEFTVPTLEPWTLYVRLQLLCVSHMPCPCLISHGVSDEPC